MIECADEEEEIYQHRTMASLTANQQEEKYENIKKKNRRKKRIMKEYVRKLSKQLESSSSWTERKNLSKYIWKYTQTRIFVENVFFSCVCVCDCDVAELMMIRIYVFVNQWIYVSFVLATHNTHTHTYSLRYGSFAFNIFGRCGFTYTVESNYAMKMVSR